MKVAIVHYWLVNMRGGEKVLEALCEMYPDADIYTHVLDRDVLPETIKRHSIHTTFIQKLPASRRLYKYYLPLMPLALRLLDLRGYDLVISSESGPSKGVRKGPGAYHVCYCHTPMRYIWDMYDDYRRGASVLVRAIMSLMVGYLRAYDLASATGVDLFVANSVFVADRIARIYHRDSVVVYPPVPVEEFAVSESLDDYYLYVGELTAYKRPALAVDAFNASGRRLVVVGDGELYNELRERADGNIEFVGRQPDERLKAWYSGCRAPIFPGVEDFGIVPVEAMASGRPVIAFRGGGALETVVEDETGVFFDRQDPQALNDAVCRFEQLQSRFSGAAIAAHAARFDGARFVREFRALVENETAR